FLIMLMCALQWQQFVNQFITSQWLMHSVGLLNRAVNGYGSFKYVKLVQAIIRILEALHGMENAHVLLAHTSIPFGVSGAEDEGMTALGYILRAAKAIGLPDSFRGSCIRSASMTLLAQVVAVEADRGVMER